MLSKSSPLCSASSHPGVNFTGPATTTPELPGDVCPRNGSRSLASPSGFLSVNQSIQIRTSHSTF